MEEWKINTKGRVGGLVGAFNSLSPSSSKRPSLTFLNHCAPLIIPSCFLKTHSLAPLFIHALFLTHCLFTVSVYPLFSSKFLHACEKYITYVTDMVKYSPLYNIPKRSLLELIKTFQHAETQTPNIPNY